MPKIQTKQINAKDGTIEVYNSVDVNLSTGANPTAWTDVNFDTEAFKGSIYTHSTVTNNFEITFDESGYYEFEYSVTIDNSSSSSRSSAEIEVQFDTGGGYTTVPRTTSYTYNRSFTVGLDTKTKRFGEQMSAGDKVKIRVRKIAGNNPTQLVVVAAATSFLIRRIE
jgi:hypothetical protein